MIAFAQVINDDITPQVRAIAEKFPREFNRALHSIGQSLRKRVAAEFAAGTPGGSRFVGLDPLTIALRSAGNRAATAILKRKKAKRVSRKILEQVKQAKSGFGGKLPQLARYDVTGGTIRVGYLDHAKDAVARYQTAESRRLTRFEHAAIGARLGSRYKHPNRYKRPARLIFAPYATDPQLPAEIDRKLVEVTQKIANSRSRP